MLPFGPGSVSLRLYPHNELTAGHIVRELSAQAGLALRAGFDGVMTTDHQVGFAGYMAQPLQLASLLIAEHAGRAGGGRLPLLLPSSAQATASFVAEERSPGSTLAIRCAVALRRWYLRGALPLDFEAAGVDQREAVDRFKAELPRLVAMLRGVDLGLLEADPALRACRSDPVPVLSAAVSVTAAVRAAQCGAGILMEGMSTPAALARLTEAYAEAGGSGPKVLIRRVWLGRVSSGLVAQQRAVYESYTPNNAFGDDQTIASDEPADLVGRILEVVEEVGADALNLRVQLPGMSPEQVRDQIVRIGETVVGPLKACWRPGHTA